MNKISMLIIPLLLGAFSVFAASPLENAVRRGDLAAVKQAIAEGGDVNAPGTAGLLPLMWAAYVNQPEIVQELIDNGADINAKNKNGLTVIGYTKGYIRPESMRIIREASIANQVKLSVDDIELLAEAGFGTIASYNADFAAYSAASKAAVTGAAATGAIPLTKDPIGIIHQYMK